MDRNSQLLRILTQSWEKSANVNQNFTCFHILIRHIVLFLNKLRHTLLLLQVQAYTISAKMKNMKVIMIDWNAYGNAEMEETFRARGYEVSKCAFDSGAPAEKRGRMLDDLRSAMDGFRPDYVFSYHYFPEISDVCEAVNVPYLAWIYDSPVFDLYSPSVLNHVNRIFVFDRGVADEFAAGGIPTVHYMPLGACVRDANGKADIGAVSAGTYTSDVTFIGSMYSEPKHRLYDKFSSVSPYVHGYLDAIIETQKHLYGVNILEKFITPEIEAEMQKAYPTDPNSRNIMSPAKLYSQFVLSRQVTSLERREIMEILGKYALNGISGAPDVLDPTTSIGLHGHDDDVQTAHYEMNKSGHIDSASRDIRISLYTHDPALRIPGIRNMGPVNYGPEMYSIFASSKINLNITLRSILTGIPLRALDIMSCGGFLLSNYQEELCEYFIPGEDFDYYEDYEDLLNKVDYYLTHDAKREAMARSAQEKIRTEHTLSSRLDAIETYL